MTLFFLNSIHNQFPYCQAPSPVPGPSQHSCSKERTWIDTIIKQATTTQPPPLNFSKVETWNSSYLTTQNFKGVDLDWHYNQAGNVLCPADNKANDHCLMSNLLNYFIPLRTPSTHASHWTSSYLFHSWGDVVSYEIIFGLQIHQRSRMLKALFTWGYLDFYASCDNQETTDSESCQW